MLKINELKSLYLGVQGENLQQTLQIDMNDWLVGHPNAAISLWHKINGAEVPVPTGATMDLETGVLSWSPTSADTAHNGLGTAEVRMTDGSVIKKKEAVTVTAPSITLDGSVVGSGWQYYINVIEALKNAAVEAKNRSEEIVADVAKAVAGEVINDDAGEGVTDQGWSADKLIAQFVLKADAAEMAAALALLTKFTDVYAGCTEYTPATTASFNKSLWYHEVGTKYFCILKKDTLDITQASAYHLPAATNDDWEVFSIITLMKNNKEGIAEAVLAAERAQAAAEAAAAASVGLYLDEDGDLCQMDE